MLLPSGRGLWTDAIARPKEGGWWKWFRSIVSTDFRKFPAWHWTALDVRSRGAYSRVVKSPTVDGRTTYGHTIEIFPVVKETTLETESLLLIFNRS